MKTSLDEMTLLNYVNDQLAFFGTRASSTILAAAVEKAAYCFKHCSNKYYRDVDGEVVFTHTHSAQYCAFLYFLSRAAFERNDTKLATGAYLLNKMLNSVDIFYEVELPEIFALEHPVGTVLGRAHYGNRLHISQNTTIGNNHGIYPVIGENVVVHFGSSIIGETIVGNNVEVATNTHIKDDRIPSNCIVFGASPNLIIKEKDEQEMLARLCFFTA